MAMLTLLFLFISCQVRAACNDFIECTQKFASLNLLALGPGLIAGLPVSLSSKVHESQSSQEARDIIICKVRDPLPVEGGQGVQDQSGAETSSVTDGEAETGAGALLDKLPEQFKGLEVHNVPLHMSELTCSRGKTGLLQAEQCPSIAVP